MNLADKYRPKQWSEVLAQPDVIATIDRLRTRSSLAGRAYWLAGQSGTGKTTIARLLAAEIADDMCVDEIDAGVCTLAKLRDIEDSMCLAGWGKGGRVYIINEAHGLRRDVIRQLLVILERLPSHVAVIFTTTCDGEEKLFDDCDDASPLLSRCTRLKLARRDLAQVFALRAQQIAIAEGLDGQPSQSYLRLVQSHKNNFRAVLMAIESGEMIK